MTSPVNTTATTPSRGRWIFSGFLVIALVAGLYLLLISRQSTKPNLTSTTMASLPAKPLIPSPYREALSSVVLLEMRDAEGAFLGHASGFFVEEDEIATDLGVIAGASKGVATVVNQGAVYEVSAVSGVDRERGIALLKVEGGKAAPLRVAANPSTASGSKVALLSSSASAQGDYAPATVTDYQKSDDLLEIGSTVASSARGGPVLNERGEVVAMLVGSNEGVTAAHAVPSARLMNVMKRQQQQTALGVAGAKDVLYDFRQSSDTSKEAKISTEVERKVLNAVFKSYLTDSSQCEGYEGDSSSPEGLKETRDSGYIVPAISASANGSFTGPGLQQTAYLITVGECGAPHAVNWGTKRLAVFTGQTLVVNVDVGDHLGILGTYDLNKDGVNELLLTGAYMQSGYLSEWAALVSVVDAKLRYLKKFETVRNDDCGSMETKPNVTAAVIYYTAGTNNTETQFRVDNYQARCAEDGESPKPSAFRYISTGKLPKT